MEEGYTMIRIIRHFLARRAVRRGAALLDRREPGWASKVNIRTLDVSSRYRCVLGQIYEGRAKTSTSTGTSISGYPCLSYLDYVSGFSYGVAIHALHTDQIVRCGFCMGRMYDFNELKEEWEKFLAERQAEEATVKQ
jgi:hypothetical protein